MAYVDSFLEFSDGQALTATATASNVVNLSTADRKIGVGEDLCVAFSVGADAVGTGTYEFSIATGATDTLGTVVTTKTVLAADLVEGASFIIPVDHTAFDQFIGVEYTLGGTSPAVTISADLRPTNMVTALSLNPSGFSIQ